MARTKEFTSDQIKAALIESNGFLSVAAKKLGCSVRTVVRYASDFPEIKQTLFDIRHERDDFVESQLMKAIKRGELTAIIFYLKTQARHRGYSEKDESRAKINELFLPDTENDVIYLQDNFDNE